MTFKPVLFADLIIWCSLLLLNLGCHKDAHQKEPGDELVFPTSKLIIQPNLQGLRFNCTHWIGKYGDFYRTSPKSSSYYLASKEIKVTFYGREGTLERPTARMAVDRRIRLKKLAFLSYDSSHLTISEDSIFHFKNMGDTKIIAKCEGLAGFLFIDTLLISFGALRPLPYIHSIKPDKETQNRTDDSILDKPLNESYIISVRSSLFTGKNMGVSK